MKPGAEELVRQALRLDEDERAEVAARLLDSLEDDDEAEGDLFASELERRALELESGAVQGVSWEDLRDKLLPGYRAP